MSKNLKVLINLAKILINKFEETRDTKYTWELPVQCDCSITEKLHVYTYISSITNEHNQYVGMYIYEDRIEVIPIDTNKSPNGVIEVPMYLPDCFDLVLNEVDLAILHLLKEN